MGNRTSTTNLTFHLIRTKYEGESLLQEAEQIDLYLEECHDDKLNGSARRSLSYAYRTISKEEADMYQEKLTQIIPQLPQRLRADLQRVDVIPLMISADGGMPHTRPQHLLCLPRLEQINSIITIRHELWHIHQRIYAMQWMEIFNKMGWKLWNGHLPDLLEGHRRFNPDTIDMPLWIYQNTWVPVPIFRDIRSPVLSEVDIWFYHVTDKRHVRQVPDELLIDFPSMPSSAYEHPRELTAYLLADPESYRELPGCKKLLSLIGHVSII